MWRIGGRVFIATVAGIILAKDGIDFAASGFIVVEAHFHSIVWSEIQWICENLLPVEVELEIIVAVNVTSDSHCSVERY